MMSLERRGEHTTPGDLGAGSDMGAIGDARRCWGCRKLWPRDAMQWGSVTEGPLSFPRSVRVLRCPDCLS